MWLQICRVIIKNFIIIILFVCVFELVFSCWIKPQLWWIKIIVRAKRNNKSSVQVWLVFTNGSPMYAISVCFSFSFSFCENWKVHSFECACVVFTGFPFFFFSHTLSLTMCVCARVWVWIFFHFCSFGFVLYPHHYDH